MLTGYKEYKLGLSPTGRTINSKRKTKKAEMKEKTLREGGVLCHGCVASTA